MSTKIVKLTALNVEALTLMAPGHTSLMETTKTTATFVGLTAYEALGVVQRMRESAGERYGRKGGAYQALHAVVRKLLTLAEAEQASEEFTRAHSARVEAMRDSGALADGLAAAKRRSEARAEADAASDPLMTLLDTPARTGLTITVGTPEPKPVHAAAMSPVAVRVHAALSDAQVARAMATLAEQASTGAAALARFQRSQGGGRVAGRLLAASKTGQRRPRRGRRG